MIAPAQQIKPICKVGKDCGRSMALGRKFRRLVPQPDCQSEIAKSSSGRPSSPQGEKVPRSAPDGAIAKPMPS
ncbi:hypothetical protein CK215_04710 [Mesorhizobium sp. WSM3864]|nr:hypothetical protein CK215_04710 [Mesorhizobium sp. WSM3864]